MSEREPATTPLPHPTPLSRPHWEGCRNGVLRVQQCRACRTIVFIPQPICTGCQGDTLEWIDTSGRGTVYSYTIVHRPPRPQFDVPYVIAIVELEEGWHMLTNVVGCDPTDVSIGMAVRVAFRRMSEEITLPMFEPYDWLARRANRARCARDSF